MMNGLDSPPSTGFFNVFSSSRGRPSSTASSVVIGPEITSGNGLKTKNWGKDSKSMISGCCGTMVIIVSDTKTTTNVTVGCYVIYLKIRE